MKTLKTSLPDAVSIHAALINITSKNDFPFEFAWEIDDITETLEKHVKRYEVERATIIKDCAEPQGEMDSTGKQMYNILKPEDFKKRMDALESVEITVKLTPIKYEKLKGIKDLTINPQDLSILRKHLIEKESVKAKPNGKK